MPQEPGQDGGIFAPAVGRGDDEGAPLAAREALDDIAPAVVVLQLDAAAVTAAGAWGIAAVALPRWEAE